MKRSKKSKRQTEAKKTGKVTKQITFDAIPVSQSNETLYLFKAKASVLFAALSINRRIEGKDEGYQRVLSPARVQAIARFIEQKRPIPGAITIDLDSATYDTKKGRLTVPKGSDVGWVIDGQHRLAGADLAARNENGPDIELPVVAFVGLSEARQIEQFVTINREAKNVPTSLYLDLLRQLPTKKSADVARERAADLGTQLRRDEESPFFQRIAVTSSPKPGQLSLTNFVRKIAPVVSPDKGILTAYTEREQIAVVANYYKALRQVFSSEFETKDSVFFKTIGFGALWNVFPTFFSLTLKNHHGFEVKDAVAMFKYLEGTDFKSWRQYGTGSQAEITAGEDLKATLLLAIKGEEGVEGALRV